MSQRSPDDDRAGSGHDGEFPDRDFSEWLDIVIPDDARELDAEAAVVRRELQTQGHLTPVERAFKTRRWQRSGISGPLVALVLIVVAFFGSLVLLLPSPQAKPAPRMLAHPRSPVGQVGGLLPDLALRDSDGDQLRIRDVRPALIALVPQGCGCRDTLRRMIGQTRETNLNVLVVQGRESAQLPSSSSPERVHAVADPHWTLGRIYHASTADLTALFVRSDGTLYKAHPHVGASTFLSDDMLAVAGS